MRLRGPLFLFLPREQLFSLVSCKLASTGLQRPVPGTPVIFPALIPLRNITVWVQTGPEEMMVVAVQRNPRGKVPR